VSFLASPNSDVQYSAAFSFAAVANALGRDRFSSELLASFQRCCSAGDSRVRRTLAFGLASFAAVVDRPNLTDAAFDLVRDIPDVAIGVISRLADLLVHVDDQCAFAVAVRNPGARFAAWRMRLRVSEQLRRCKAFFDRRTLIDCACELIDDPVAAVRTDAAVSLAELLRAEDIAIAEDLADSIGHSGRFIAARVLRLASPAVAECGRECIRMLAGDRVPEVRAEAEAALRRIVR
jgi:hypothetical protein